ncbi:MAG: TolC family protein [Planctomycetes bacterium]|nr:TolC family protein [Planctomycetota bacterium]
MSVACCLVAPPSLAQDSEGRGTDAGDREEPPNPEHRTPTHDEEYRLPLFRSLREAPKSPVRREEVEDAPTSVALSLEETLVSALARNLDLRVESFGPELREADVLAARSKFDPVGRWSISRARSIQQGSSQLAGAQSVQNVTDQMTTGVKKLGAVGTTYDFSINGTRTATNNSFANRRVQYETNATLLVTQPLLRNLGFDVQRADTNLALAAKDQSYFKFQEVAQDVLARTEKAYWDLVFAREDLAIQEDSLRLAEEALQISQIKREVGTASKIDVLDAQSDVAEARRVLILARNAVKDAEDKLKNLFHPRDMNFLWNVTLVPTENLPLEVPRVSGTAIDLFESIDHALAYRPDLLQLRTDVSRQGIEIQRAKNQLLPKLDVEAKVVLNGLEDSFEQAMDTTTTADFYQWQAGLALEIPFGNRSALAAYQRALIGHRQASARVERLERQAILEVRTAVRAVQSRLEEINAAKSAKFFAKEKWEAEKSRHQAGERTAFEVNEFRNDYIKARSNEVRAFTEYFKAVADLKKAESSALEELRRKGYQVAPAASP